MKVRGIAGAIDRRRLEIDFAMSDTNAVCVGRLITSPKFHLVETFMQLEKQ
jgi:hypothetical protein